MNKRFSHWQEPIFNSEDMTKWHWICQHRQKFKLGKFTDIGAFTYINARYGVEIEDEVQIGSHCSIYSHSTIDNKEGKVIIKKGAKIGTHSTIMPGVTIGENAIIGAYSFVKEDVADGNIVYGIPAKAAIKQKK
jgi:acetyltransferase-like isoleucine patch superfamily enzyme